jgi:hypothetical protein
MELHYQSEVRLSGLEMTSGLSVTLLQNPTITIRQLSIIQQHMNKFLFF